MTTSMILDVGFIVILIVFALAGLRRGPWPEVVALGGILLGALLADEWGDVWGRDLAASVGVLGAQGAQMVARAALFLLPLIVVGYGGAVLLPRLGRLSPRGRLAGAGLGLFNGAAIVALLLRNWQYSQGVATGPLMTDPVGRALLEWAGWWPLVLALGGILAVISAVVRRAGRATPPVPVSQPSPATSAIPTTTPAPAPKPSIDPYAPLGPLPSNSAPTATIPTRPASNGGGGTSSAPVAAKPARGPDQRLCRTCGYALAPGAAFCPNCGTPV
jgi:uncharacterized membrane protein required for colicin V production